jgi:hypothetical protein
VVGELQQRYGQAAVRCQPVTRDTAVARRGAWVLRLSDLSGACAAARAPRARQVSEAIAELFQRKSRRKMWSPR